MKIINFGDKYFKIKIKPYSNKIITSFHGKTPKDRFEFMRRSLRVTDSVF